MMPTSFMDSTHVEKILLLLEKNRWDSRDTWRGVATALKNEYGEAYKALWKQMSKVSPRYDEEDAEKIWDTVGRPDYDGPKMTMKSVVKWAGEDDPCGYAVYRAYSIPQIVRDNWDKGDRGLGEIMHYLMKGTLKKTGKRCRDYYILDEDTCRWVSVEDGWVKNVASKVLEGMLRDVDLWLSTQAAQLCIGKEEESRSKEDLDAKKKEVARLIRYIQSSRGVKNTMDFAGPLLIDETFEKRLNFIGEPKKVTDFTRQYLAEQDGVQAFLAENCEFAEEFRESSVALFHMYLEESGDSNDREKWFHGQMKNKGFVKKVLQIKGKSTRGYMGLRLRHDE